jgi:hypothetical protein
MKKILLLIFIFIGIQGYCQETDFKIDSNAIVWQKVYQSNDTLFLNMYINQINTNSFTNSLEFKNNIFSGRTNQHNPKLKGPYWLRHPFDCFVSIEFKNDRYKVTVKEITFRGPVLTIYGVEDKLDYNLNDNALSNGAFKTNKKILAAIDSLHTFFSNTFKISEVKKADW